jgi:hypothetical protein
MMPVIEIPPSEKNWRSSAAIMALFMTAGICADVRTCRFRPPSLIVPIVFPFRK